MNVLSAFASTSAAVLISATLWAVAHSFFAEPSALINDDPGVTGTAAPTASQNLFARDQLYKSSP